ncbi:hypothetical protein CHGG_02191 [Chaetomium globosum CBS 148.51]|uniref:Uncharacterized protein n=1 Tax=Chaetomium globosum (strain ATCC 6205 / CBS 148.51 / DSM 1962 / NBRC 6347 / NRRL 1970) TaxID=306901 RepID=Q2HC63_CHAGB|nr:uncharacterized protein CHGG_02191 [Chaetomium globosum CBS 148.51]EAQ90256.1 hypothetical protein CHGG_02191 [Chaetomium globosum CBS 148.51]
MHLPTLLATALTLVLTTTATPTGSTPPPLHKRCSPRYDPDLALGYYPPAPCWQTFDTACQPHLAPGTEMTLDAPHGLAVVYGLSENCAAQIAEEKAREADGRKNYGWKEEHGLLTVVEGGDFGD